MAALATQNTDIANGLVPTYAACTGGGDSFTPDPDTMLHVKNASGGSLTVKVVTQALVATLGITQVSVAVAAGTERMIGTFPPNIFADSTGQAQITYPGGVTSLTIAVIRTPRPLGS